MEPNYKDSQDELYEGCDLLVISLGEELGQFGFKPKYDGAFVTAFLTQIAAAKSIPDDVQRSAVHEVMRIEMQNRVKTDMRGALGDLRLYIRDAYADVEVRAVRLKEAGFDDYEKAMNLNWEKVKGILKNANDFIGLHLADLTANNNMPPAFQTVISNMKASADSDVTAFLNTRENTKQVSSDKVSANNALYKAATDICEDGQHVFRNNEAKKSQFVWDSIMTIVSPPGAAGLRLDVKEEGTNLPIGSVNVVIQREDGGIPLELVTNADSKGYFESLEPGVYNGTVKKTGYVDLSVTFEISTGVTSFKHWVLTPNP